MFEFLRRHLFGEDEIKKQGPRFPRDSARQGWQSHRFPGTDIVVFLPEEVAAAFDPEGVLHGTTNGQEAQFSATLHNDFEENPFASLDFVSHLARKNRRKLRDFGVYRYYFDPTDEEITATALRFWVIGIPGAVVVVSILCDGKKPVSEPLRAIRREIPCIVGEQL